MAKRPVASSVADYIASFPPRVRAALKQVRRTVRAAAPGVGEGISYAIVKFDLGGKYVFYMAGWPEHVGLYPVNGAVAATLRQELAPYTSGKATVRFPLSEPMPLDLIARMVRARVSELTSSKPAKPRAVRTTARRGREQEL